MTGRITVVLGPPCAGKSTYVEQNRTSTDVVVDFDKLAVALGATMSHDQPADIKNATFAARRAVIDHLLSRSNAYAWIIHSAPKPEWMQRYAEAGANVIKLDPGIDVCLARATDDERPQRTVDSIHEWYDNNANPVSQTAQRSPAESVLQRFNNAYASGRFSDLSRRLNAART
ncbi:hypothetical protein PP713_14005 [Mycobacterium sp. CSUR Q5927]|nr:hypothetical protein [Mycobacterium sp. CSUR Q5927]